jgi:hypothetical protein
VDWKIFEEKLFILTICTKFPLLFSKISCPVQQTALAKIQNGGAGPE